jgi:phosphoribosylformylglycinamidine cyclo-ligase
MYRVFNCGVGMVLILDADASADAIKHLKAQGENAWLIGKIVKNDGE